MARNYHTLNSQTSVSEEKLTTFLRKNGQQLLPMVDLITQSRVALEELIDGWDERCWKPFWRSRRSKWLGFGSQEKHGKKQCCGTDDRRAELISGIGS